MTSLPARIAMVAVAAIGTMLTRPALAQQAGPDTVTITEETPGLAKRAKIGGDVARKTALARVRNGTITKAELEEEDGKLIYSFDIKAAGKSGIEEIHVDARTGKVVAVEHEDESAPEPGANPKPAGAKPPPAVR